MNAEFLTQKTLAEAARVQDAAMDFIEHELGANYFPKNWENLKSKEDPNGRIERWIKDLGIEVGSKDVANAIDELAKNP